MKKRSLEIQTRDVEGPFDHIRTCIHSPLKITFSVGTSQCKVAIGPCLEIVTVNKFRTALAKLRLSSHRLEVEAGRWARPSAIPFSERLCNACNKLEDEYFALEHYIFGFKKIIYMSIKNAMGIIVTGLLLMRILLEGGFLKQPHTTIILS